MALFDGISNAISSVASKAFDCIMSVFGAGGVGKKKYPLLKGVTNDPSYRDGTWKESQGYAFEVVDVSVDTGRQFPLDGWEAFPLQINPQELSIDEIFAIEVTPTLRGVVVEHQGTVLKDITISGTTGVSPKRAEGGATPRTGKPILSSGHSGFEEFHELRSYFRSYVEAKRVDDTSNGFETRLIFKNYKDSEYLFVEPQKFTMKRSASRPHLYDYTIVLKAIGVAEGQKNGNLGKFGIISDIADKLDQASELISIGTAIINESVGLIRQVERDVNNTLFGPLRSINSALTAMKGGQSSLFGPFGITKRFFESFDNELGRIKANFNDLLGKDISSYNNAVGRVSTVVGTAGRESTYPELQVLNGMNKIKRGVSILLSENALFAEDASDETARVKEFYGDKVTFRKASSTRNAAILGDDNLQTIAARELGDPDRFKELISLNNLKFPYIDEAGGEGVLKPGDPVIIPQSTGANDTGVKKNKEFEITRLLNEAEKNLGVDIRLNNNNDLATSNTGDLDLIAGIDNMSQAIIVKLLLEPGSLQRHPEIGTGLEIGRKSSNARLSEIRRNIVSSFSSDLRVEAIPVLDIIQEGNTIYINMMVKLTSLEQPVPLPITLQAG
jgi:hypothetical protein